MNIRIEDVFTPQSVVDNSIRIPDASGWFPYDHPAGATHALKNDYTLTGDMNIDLTNEFMEMPYGI